MSEAHFLLFGNSTPQKTKHKSGKEPSIRCSSPKVGQVCSRPGGFPDHSAAICLRQGCPASATNKAQCQLGLSTLEDVESALAEAARGNQPKQAGC